MYAEMHLMPCKNAVQKDIFARQRKKKKKEAKNEEPRIEFTCFFLQEESYLFFTFLKIYETNSILKNFKGHVFLRFAL
jgi:hypothetical protein